MHPKLNANLDTEAGEITYFDRENIAFAVDTERGLLTPVVKDAGDLSIAGLAKKIADVAGRTRNNKITPDDLTGGTFTITNLGSFGALFDTPIINQPQVAILGPGAVVKRPVVIDDANLGETIAVRYMVYLSLTLRPPARRRRRRRPLPGRRQAAPRVRLLRGLTRRTTTTARDLLVPGRRASSAVLRSRRRTTPSRSRPTWYAETRRSKKFESSCTSWSSMNASGFGEP